MFTPYKLAITNYIMYIIHNNFVRADFIAKNPQKAENNTKKNKLLRYVQEISQLTNITETKKGIKRSHPNQTSPLPLPMSEHKKTKQLTHTHFHTSLTTSSSILYVQIYTCKLAQTEQN